MKHFLALSFLFSFSTTTAQITLENTFTPLPGASTYFQVVQFGFGGDKFVYDNKTDKKVYIYDLNGILEKTISMPAVIQTTNYQVTYPSDNLFDTDSTVEIMVTHQLGLGAFSNLYIFNEDGSILFERDSINGGIPDDPYWVSEFGRVVPTDNGTKLILSQKTFGYEVYSLPGNLPCNACENGVYTGGFVGPSPNENRSSLSNPFPNPTNNQTRIDYQLPHGINQGELIFYRGNGTEVKRFKVTSVFNFIYVSANELPSGTYYYSLQTLAGKSEGKKMVVIR